MALLQIAFACAEALACLVQAGSAPEAGERNHEVVSCPLTENRYTFFWSVKLGKRDGYATCSKRMA